MTISKTERRQRNQAYMKIIKELGLAPPATSPYAREFTPKKVSENDSPIVKASRDPNDDSPVSDWIVAPFSPNVAAPPETQTDSSIIVDFLESAQTAKQLVDDIHTFKPSPEEARKIAVVVGKASEGKSTSAEWMFSTTLDKDAVKTWENLTKAQRNGGRTKPASARAVAAVVKNARDCDKMAINEPEASRYPAGFHSNTAVNTIFVNSATHQESRGGTDTTLFLNYIPNHLLSRAVPILNVTIDLPDGLNKRKLIQALGPSLILGKQIGLKDNPAQDALFTKTVSGNPIHPDTFPRRSIGTDTFNLPQTLGRTREQYATFLNQPDPHPEDQFSPLGVIEDFTFEFDGGDLGSLNTREIAKGSLMLAFPDRTKLTGLDQLIIGTNGLLTLTIEFGWSILPDQLFDTSVPAKASDPLVEYVNSQRIRFGATTTLNGIDFTESGAAKVNLGLTDPSLDDAVPPVGKEDVSSYMTIINQSNPRFVNFIGHYLEKNARKPSDDIAEVTGYNKTLTRIITPAERTANDASFKTRKDAFDKKAGKKHYKVEQLAKIKTGEAFKDGDLILEEMRIAEMVNTEELKGYDYVFINMKKGGLYVDYIKSLADATETAMDALGTNAKKHFKPATPNKVALIRKAVETESVYLTVGPITTKSTAFPHSEVFKHVDKAADFLRKQLDKYAKAYKKKLSDLNIKAIDASTEGSKQFNRIVKTRTLDVTPHIAGSELVQVPSTFHDDLKIPTPVKGEAAYVYLGKSKHPYPNTLRGQVGTKSQHEGKKKKAKKAAEGVLDVISSSDLMEARIKTLFQVHKHVLSNGFIVNRSATPGNRIVDKKGKPVDIAKVLKGDSKVSDVGGVMTFWANHPNASAFIPFSHIVHFSVVQSLYATGLYDEIQVVYFKMNSECGRMSNQSIGDIPITQNYNQTFARAPDAFAFLNAVISNQINRWNGATPYGFVEVEDKKKKTKTITVAKTTPGTVPKVSYLTRVLYAKGPDNKKRKILRLSFYDSFSTIDKGAGQRVMNSMRNDGRTTAFSHVQAENQASSEAIREKMLLNALTEAKVISKQKAPLGSLTIDTGPKTWRVIKSAIKASHPHLNYGAVGNGVLGASVNGKMSGTEETNKMAEALKFQNQESAQRRHSAIQAGKAPDIALAEITAASKTVDIDLVGCPALQVGGMYFIDFYTGTDVDNFYILKHIKHQISGNKFTTIGTFHLWSSNARVTIPGKAQALEKLIETANPSKPPS